MEDSPVERLQRDYSAPSANENMLSIVNQLVTIENLDST